MSERGPHRRRFSDHDLEHGFEDQEDDSEDRLSYMLWASLFFSLAIFAQFPGLDLLVSMNYYSSDQGFFHRNDPLVLALYDWTPWIGRALVLALFVYAVLAPFIAWMLARAGQLELAARSRGPWRHMAAVAVCCALLGNGLVVEGILKNFMGRPRPVQVQQFGGPDVYHGPFVPGPDPHDHRSFVSSHAAAGFALIGLGMTCGPVWRRRWLLIGIGTGGLVGWGRMMQGGHFLSDILFAFYAVWLSCELVGWIDRKRLARRAAGQSPEA
jgi:lipid A 4'-phosphatase